MFLTFYNNIFSLFFLNITLRFTAFHFCETSFLLWLWLWSWLWFTDTLDKRRNDALMNNTLTSLTWHYNWISWFLVLWLSGFLHLSQLSAFHLFYLTLYSWFWFRNNCWKWNRYYCTCCCFAGKKITFQLNFCQRSLCIHLIWLNPITIWLQFTAHVIWLSWSCSPWVIIPHPHFCSDATKCRRTILWNLPPKNGFKKLIWTLFKESFQKHFNL